MISDKEAMRFFNKVYPENIYLDANGKVYQTPDYHRCGYVRMLPKTEVAQADDSPSMVDLDAWIEDVAQHVIANRDNTVDPADAFDVAVMAVKYLHARGLLAVKEKAQERGEETK